jgi:hypothetical protein
MVNERIVLEWNEVGDVWHMKKEDGIFIQEFFNCGNIHQFFQGLDKSKENKYLVTIAKIGE